MCNQKHVFEALSLNALAVKVMKGIYSPISSEYSRELRALVDEMLSQNSKNRPSIFEILTRPFLFGKVKNYIKKIYKAKEMYES
jgi:NIMA (never in mitosis gene a)-related kinase